MMRIAILGAGSLGTVIGAYIAEGGQDVELIDVYEAHVQALNEKGAKIIGTTEMTAKVKAVTPEKMTGVYDLVLLLTKQLYNDSVLTNLLPFLHDSSVVCSLQNGIPESKIAEIVGCERVIAGAVEFGATFTEPGVSELTTEYNRFKQYAFQIGELNGEKTARIQKIQEVLALVGGTHISENLVGTKWSKLLINNAFSGLSAAMNTTYGGVLDNEISVRSAAHIIDETIKVGHANGITFAKMNDFDIASLEIREADDIEQHIKTLRVIIEPARLLKASMLQDLEKKRKTEIDFINGVVPQLAKGIATPYNDLVVAIVKQAEQEGSLPDFDTTVLALAELNNK